MEADSFKKPMKQNITLFRHLCKQIKVEIDFLKSL